MLGDLKRVFLFKDFSDDELKLLIDAGQERNYIAGQELFFSGQKADSFLLVLQGTVKLVKSSEEGDEIVLAQLASGEHFGEMGFLLHQAARTATAVVTESARVFEISYSNLAEVLEKNISLSAKFYRSLSRFLANRLAETTKELLK
jgi:CRP-like cAMP-binding protein